MHRFLLLAVALASVIAQDLTSIRTQHTQQFQPYNPYYATGYHPNTKFKPGTAYKAIPPLYNPSDVCFNPNYYGFLNTAEGISQTSPVPQPNVYYVPDGNTRPSLPSAAYPAPAWPPYQYPPWTYMGSPAPSIQPTNQLMGSSSPTSTLHERSRSTDQNETTTTPKPITITRPTISVKIVPPTFNENATVMTNMAPVLTDQDTDQNPRLSETKRKMIKKLLEMGSKYLKSKEDRLGREASTATDGDTLAKSQFASDNEMVILPNERVRQNNEYSLPKDVFEDVKQPPSSFERMKILTEFNPPA